jgi:hypothetical protein
MLHATMYGGNGRYEGETGSWYGDEVAEGERRGERAGRVRWRAGGSEGDDVGLGVELWRYKKWYGGRVRVALLRGETVAEVEKDELCQP